MTFTRRDVWGPAAADSTIAHYRAAVGVMQARDAKDPTSWAFQAAMHGSHQQPGKWPYNQCKHATWFFLPWHRMYVWFFEQIVRAAIPDRAAAGHWALPYWNYGAGGRHATLPTGFRAAHVDGHPNPLHVQRRAAGINDGTGSIPAHTGVPAAAMRCPTFTGPSQGQRTPEFGGGPSNPAVQFARWTGALENSPHNMVHDLVGGPDGLMADPDLAAADPIFWLHHANIDRIWADWIAQGAGRADPTDHAWRGQAFRFYEPDGKEVTLTCADVMHTASRPLGYEYEPAAPAPQITTLPRALTGASVPDGGDGDHHAPEIVGGSSSPVQLTGGRVDVAVEIDPSAAAAAVGAGGVAQRVLLTIEEIETEGNPGTPYGLYVNLPQGADADVAAAHYAGAISFFGARRAQHPKGDEAPHSLVISHDITQLVSALRGEGQWDGRRIVISFEPVALASPDGTPGADGPAADHAAVSIGQVRILYA
jgi:tyrosinase